MKLDKLTDNQYNAYHELLTWYPIPAQAATRIGKEYMRIRFTSSAKGCMECLRCVFRHEIRIDKNGSVSRTCRIVESN